MVEYHLAKVAVAGSSPVARSTLKMEQKPAEKTAGFSFQDLFGSWQGHDNA